MACFVRPFFVSEYGMHLSVLEIDKLSKCYFLFDKPQHRLLSYFFPQYQKKCREFWALNNVSFSLKQGETIGIIGRNGSGKSTLLQIISGTLSPTAGNVQLQGRIAALLELGAGFNPEFTGRENILLNAAIYGLSREEILSKLDDIIAFASIGEFIDQPVQHYSSGMFVRLAFAVIAHVDADILIIDEALAVGDALFAQKCMRFLEEFKKNGSILFVSHDSGAVTRLCDRALWLENGNMRMLGEAKEVSEAYLEHLYSEKQSVSLNERTELTYDEPDLAPVPDYAHWYDARESYLQASPLRADYRIHAFDPDAKEFGTGKVVLENICFRDESGRPLSWVVGGMKVSLEVALHSLSPVDDFIVGFLVKNRLGQVLFGENNCLFSLDSPVQLLAGKHYIARFALTMPYLAEGEYVVSVGMASGSQGEHVQHCWRHDAMVFTVTGGHVVHGLMGIPVGHFDITALE